MRQRSRNNDEKNNRREQILDSAEYLYIEKGLDRCSMDDIARHAGLSRPLIYVYFKNKQDIYLGLCMRAAHSLRDRIVSAANEQASGIEKVRAMGEAYYQFYREERNYFNIQSAAMGKHGHDVQGANDAQPPQPSPLVEKDCEIMDFMANCLTAGVEDGSIKPEIADHPMQTALFLRGTLHGVILLQEAGGPQLFERDQLDREALIHYTINTIVDEVLKQ